MSRQSAGILLYRFKESKLEVLLVHPGGPFWSHKDDGVWSIPKGEIHDNEDILIAAKREFFEETGVNAEGNFIKLNAIRMHSGKIIHAFALEGDLDETEVHSNLFSIEWPPKSGKIQQFPEIDKAEWMDMVMVRKKINRSQIPIISELENMLQQYENELVK